MTGNKHRIFLDFNSEAVYIVKWEQSFLGGDDKGRKDCRTSYQSGVNLFATWLPVANYRAWLNSLWSLTVIIIKTTYPLGCYTRFWVRLSFKLLAYVIPLWITITTNGKNKAFTCIRWINKLFSLNWSQVSLGKGNRLIFYEFISIEREKGGPKIRKRMHQK